MILVRADIPCKEVKVSSIPDDIGTIFIELSIHKIKWLLMGGYNPHKDHISYFVYEVRSRLDKLVGKYDNLLLLGYFNSFIKEKT